MATTYVVITTSNLRNSSAVQLRPAAWKTWIDNAPGIRLKKKKKGECGCGGCRLKYSNTWHKFWHSRNSMVVVLVKQSKQNSFFFKTKRHCSITNTSPPRPPLPPLIINLCRRVRQTDPPTFSRPTRAQQSRSVRRSITCARAPRAQLRRLRQQRRRRRRRRLPPWQARAPKWRLMRSFALFYRDPGGDKRFVVKKIITKFMESW